MSDPNLPTPRSQIHTSKGALDHSTSPNMDLKTKCMLISSVRLVCVVGHALASSAASEGLDMTNHSEVLTDPVQEWLAALAFICRSREIRELMDRLEKEDKAYPQTVIRMEEE